MKLFKIRDGIIAVEKDAYYHLNESWDEFINNDDIYARTKNLINTAKQVGEESIKGALAPIGTQQELWACGVTYLKSMVGRQEESKASGGADFYGKVYDAERPECFFKCNPSRVADPGQPVRIRRDSSWDVPEPELTLVVTSSGKIIGYTVGNDMSSRSIEGENPLYLPQAKTYDGCAALGPCVFISPEPFSTENTITLTIKRREKVVYEGCVSVKQMKRSPEELTAYIFRECSFKYGCLIMTGTGIVPDSHFTLHSADEISIAIDEIGVLTNPVA